MRIWCPVHFCAMRTVTVFACSIAQETVDTCERQVLMAGCSYFGHMACKPMDGEL